MKDKKLNLVTPGNARYQPKSLQEYFGYDHNSRFVARTELAAMKTLGELGVIPEASMSQLTPERSGEICDITTSEVDEMEKKTKHDIRAWVQLARPKLPEPLQPWLHVPLTSYDALDTARIVQYKEAHEEEIVPLKHAIYRELVAKIKETADVVQVGRTHGQHAVPITVGFWLANILWRLKGAFDYCDAMHEELRGKISGPVGAYNAAALLFEGVDPEEFETRVLAKLGLRPAEISTQILPPEPLARYLFGCVQVSGILAQLGRDCRHLMRSEIGEVAEAFAPGQVGSSTMAHKRNPISFENTEGQWRSARAQFAALLEGCVSEHQRDLVSSVAERDHPAIVVRMVFQLERMIGILKKLTFDRDALQRNFEQSKHLMMAEPWYIALQMYGYKGDAHELINSKAIALMTAKTPATDWIANIAGDDSDLAADLARLAESGEITINVSPMTLGEALEKLAESDEHLRSVLHSFPVRLWMKLEEPEHYVGLASRKALAIAHRIEEELERDL